nr:methyltransferase domain-containing protein [Acidobacteriota bacterium]
MTDGSRDGRTLWDAHAHADPLWAVLSNPGKQGRWGLQEFMAHGEREIARVLRHAADLGIAPPRGAALDFGCGVGRLSQAMGRRFASVTGADISPAMIALAERVNRYPDRVRYVCTAHQPLDAFPDRAFGFIYSNIVLQHVEPALSLGYLAQFLRLLDAGGLLVFQLPSHRRWHGSIEHVAMTPDGYRGRVELATPLPDALPPGEEITVTLVVRNESVRTWSQPGAGPLAAGNHWLDASGSVMLQQDDGRAPLPQMLRAGAECRVPLAMRAPAAPGSYVAEIDLVHE